MGLDFSLYKKRKDQDVNEFLFSTINEDDELAYGRKSWELVSKLATNEDVKNAYGILTSERWESLMREMDPIGDLLDKISEAYDHYEYMPDQFGEYIFTEEDKKLIAQYEYWYNKTFDDSPVLGYDFSVGYMSDFYNAKDKVREVLKDPESEVLMVISY